MGLTFLSQASLSLEFWDDTVSTAVYTINRLSTTILNCISPIEKLFGITPLYSFLKVFGCLCFPCLKPYNSHKLQSVLSMSISWIQQST